MDYGVRGLLARPAALGIRPLQFETFVHPRRDPGCARDAHTFLRPFAPQYQRALILFDYEGSGFDDTPSDALAADVRARVDVDWAGRAEVILLKPELENWVFANSPHVEACIGWAGTVPLRAWLEQRGLWNAQDAKPQHPKEALEEALRAMRQPRSSSIYDCIASKVSTRGCTDASFIRMRDVLCAWFPK